MRNHHLCILTKTGNTTEIPFFINKTKRDNSVTCLFIKEGK